MSGFIHTVHQYIVLLVRYLAIFAVIGFMPIPLFTFFGGDTLSEVDYNPLFDYFNHYEISTDAVVESVYTNAYISENKNDINEWDIDNAILWTDFLAFKLSQEGIPVIRDVVSTEGKPKVESLLALHQQIKDSDSLIPEHVQNLLLDLKAKFQLLLPIGEVTESARQWIILGLNSNEKGIKKELKSLISQFPNDNFLVITQTPVNLSKKTLQLGLPDFNIKEAKRILIQGLKITDPQAEILLMENGKSLWSLNNQNGDNQQFSLKSLLKENYHSLSDLSEKEASILQNLCQQDKMKVGKKALDLSEYGVIVKNKNYQWRNKKALLNYKLQKETLCGKGNWIDIEVISLSQPVIVEPLVSEQAQAAGSDNQTLSKSQKQENGSKFEIKNDKLNASTVNPLV